MRGSRPFVGTAGWSLPRAYAESFPAMLKLLKALHDAGVTIIPGPDGLSGYMLHRELEQLG